MSESLAPEHQPAADAPRLSVERAVPARRYADLLTAAVFFALAIGLMVSLQFNSQNPYLSEFDSYYHVKMAELIRDHGIPKQFPWLQYTILRDRFVDLQLLYHVLLIPFVTLLGPILGGKVFQVLVVALAFLVLLVILREREVKGAVWLATFSLYTLPSDFYLRMNYIRNLGLSLLFLMCGMYLTFRDRPLLLGALAFLYVWAYGGFVFLLVLPLTYVVAQLLTEERPRWRLAVACAAGTLLGVVVNPYFPSNINVLIAQIFKTGLGAERYVGLEWQPYDTWTWVQLNIVPLVVFFGAILLSLVKHMKHDAKTIAAFVYSLFFLVLFWKSKRFVEYAPLFMLLSAFLLLKPIIDEKVEEFRTGRLVRRAENLVYALALLALLPATYMFAFHAFDGRWYVGQIDRARRLTQPVFSMSAVRKAHDYLLQNAREGDIVFADDWDLFGRYFFVNTKTYYIAGLDPEFTNQYDGPPYEGEKGRLYREYADISSGRDATNLERIRTVFKARWVIVDKRHAQFYTNLKSEPRLFEEVLFATNDPERDTYPSAQEDSYHVFRVLD